MRRDVQMGNVEGNYDLLINNGDFVVENSDPQHVRHLIEADQGHYKNYPEIGVGIKRFLNSTIDGTLKRRILIHLQSDGYRPRQVQENENAVVVRI